MPKEEIFLMYVLKTVTKKIGTAGEMATTQSAGEDKMIELTQEEQLCLLTAITHQQNDIRKYIETRKNWIAIGAAPVDDKFLKNAEYELNMLNDLEERLCY